MSAASATEESSRQLWLVAAMWAAASLLMVSAALPDIATWNFPDPDDAMRLIQVRDWLGGQSWFDVTQYRLNGPEGGPMHWSRLVDIPIAAVMLSVRPFAGVHGAENAALIIVPLLTLGIAMLLVHRIALKLIGGPAALLAVAATPLSLGALKQMRIMRIDHHGWQIIAALVTMLALLDDRPRRSGIVAGLAMAMWLNISLEGLPFVAAVGVWFGWLWIADAAQGERLKYYLGALAAGGALMFGFTHAPATWFANPHDALNLAHLAGFAAAALCCLLAVQPSVADYRRRIVLLAGAGAASVAAMFAVDPLFLQDPFGSLDPLVASKWHAGVDEGLPIWRLEPWDAAVGMAQPLVGLLGGLVAIWKAPRSQRSGWIAFSFFMLAGTIGSAVVIRAATTFSVVSLPGTAFLCMIALRRARNVSLMPARALATFAALFIMAPAYAAPALVMPADPRLGKAIQSSHGCVGRADLLNLNAVAPSNFALSLNITPAILASTHHRAIASGYHRNGAGIRDVILIFAGPLDGARAILERRGVDYVAFCPNAPESIRWAANGPSGLAARLNANHPPDWLEPVTLSAGGLRVWRLRKDQPGV